MQTPTNSQRWTQWLIWNRYEECGCTMTNHISDDEHGPVLCMKVNELLHVRYRC